MAWIALPITVPCAILPTRSPVSSLGGRVEPRHCIAGTAMSDDAVKSLAFYLTGPEVARDSILLGLGEPSAIPAEAEAAIAKIFDLGGSS